MPNAQSAGRKRGAAFVRMCLPVCVCGHQERKSVLSLLSANCEDWIEFRSVIQKSHLIVEMRNQSKQRDRKRCGCLMTADPTDYGIDLLVIRSSLAMEEEAVRPTPRGRAILSQRARTCLRRSRPPETWKTSCEKGMRSIFSSCGWLWIWM